MTNTPVLVAIVLAICLCATLIIGGNAVATCQANSNQSADVCAATIR